MIFLEDPIWFPPQNVIVHFDQMSKKSSASEKRTKLFSKAVETFHAAVLLIGVQKATGRDFWIQAVGDNEGSPDVRTATKVNGDLKSQDVEVVEYRPNAKESLIEFIVRTKIRPKKYDALTTILCRISKVTRIPSLELFQKTLEQYKARFSIFILGEVWPSKRRYMMAQINPAVDMHLEFDLIAELNSSIPRPVQIFEKGLKEKNNYQPEVKHCPFEKLGICCNS